MPKKKLSKVQKQLTKIKKLEFIKALEERIDIEDAIKALKNIKKMDPFLGIKQNPIWEFNVQNKTFKTHH